MEIIAQSEQCRAVVDEDNTLILQEQERGTWTTMYYGDGYPMLLANTPANVEYATDVVTPFE